MARCSEGAMQSKCGTCRSEGNFRVAFPFPRPFWVMCGFCGVCPVWPIRPSRSVISFTSHFYSDSIHFCVVHHGALVGKLNRSFEALNEHLSESSRAVRTITRLMKRSSGPAPARPPGDNEDVMEEFWARRRNFSSVLDLV